MENLLSQYQSQCRKPIKKDGIIDDLLFESARKKVLFLCKEPNDPIQSGGDYRLWWKDEIHYTFSTRIAEWSFGILNGFPEFDSVWKEKEKTHEALKSIAFLNLKKVGGSGSSSLNELLEWTQREKLQIIYKQIDLIDPDVIICGLSWPALRNQVFTTCEWRPSGYGIPIGNWKDRMIVDFYHPSARIPGPASYCLLEKVINRL